MFVSAEDLVHRRLYGCDRGKDDRQNSAAPEQKNAENVPIFSISISIQRPYLPSWLYRCTRSFMYCTYVHKYVDISRAIQYNKEMYHFIFAIRTCVVMYFITV
jgi:hypothetical protein